MNENEIGSRIRAIRNEKGISQEKLALDSELDRTYINSVENGKRNITINSLTKITNALGVSLKDFFDNDYKVEYDPSNIVFLICCDKDNYLTTMNTGVKKESLKSIFSFDDFNKIDKLVSDEIIHIWGTSETNANTFNLLQEGNIALFANEGRIISYSTLLYKIKNYEFGEKYWISKNNKKAWPYIMIMTKPIEIDIQVSKLMEYANYKKKFIQGMNIPRGEHNILIKNYLDKVKGEK